MTFKAAVCPSCGGELQVPDNRDSVKCMYCGTDIIVREAIQAVSGVNIQNFLQLAATARDSSFNIESCNVCHRAFEQIGVYLLVRQIDFHVSECWEGWAHWIVRVLRHEDSKDFRRSRQCLSDCDN